MGAGPILWWNLLRAVAELGIARILHTRSIARGLDLAADECATGVPAQLGSRETKFVRLLSQLIPRVARRMPWRSDCLVQALAAQRWLARKGVASSLHIGGRKTVDKGFEAHAWLTVGDLVVTGWDIENFEQFAAFPSPPAKRLGS